MKRIALWIVGLTCMLGTVTGVARADEGAVASGFVVQPRMETQSSLLGGVLGTPGFLLGYRSGNLTIGVGAGFSRTSVSDGGSNKVALTIIQATPALSYDVWASGDGRARLNLVGAVGYGHASVSTESSTSSSDATIGFIPFRAGLGTDYFVHRNFAVGGEVGFQAAILTNADVAGQSQNVSVSTNNAYGALRLTFIVGQ